MIYYKLKDETRHDLLVKAFPGFNDALQESARASVGAFFVTVRISLGKEFGKSVVITFPRSEIESYEWDAFVVFTARGMEEFLTVDSDGAGGVGFALTEDYYETGNGQIEANPKCKKISFCTSKEEAKALAEAILKVAKE